MKMLVLVGAFALLLAACAPQAVEVTREIPVTVEVTRLVTEQVVQEVVVEVTRLVEVVVLATGEPAPAATATEAPPSPTPEPTPTTAVNGAGYTVQAGDTLATIAAGAGISIEALQAANNMQNSSLLIAGQELLIPGVEGAPAAAQPAPEQPAPAEPAAAPAEVEAAAGSNLLPNPSFEEGWHFYLYNELQVPDGWQLATDEGANNLEGGAGGLFNRPEVRVVPSKDLPPREHSLFILNGDKTVKAFKGGAPTSFSMFTDVPLQPGTYRLQIRFVPDTVAGYDDDRNKVYSGNPLDAEARVIAGSGGTGWQGTASGRPNTITHDFTLDQAQTVRVGGAFRNRQIMVNNGWFLDDWSLTRLE